MVDKSGRVWLVINVEALFHNGVTTVRRKGKEQLLKGFCMCSVYIQYVNESSLCAVSAAVYNITISLFTQY